MKWILHLVPLQPKKKNSKKRLKKRKKSRNSNLVADGDSESENVGDLRRRCMLTNEQNASKKQRTTPSKNATPAAPQKKKKKPVVRRVAALTMAQKDAYHPLQAGRALEDAARPARARVMLPVCPGVPKLNCPTRPHRSGTSLPEQRC